MKRTFTFFLLFALALPFLHGTTGCGLLFPGTEEDVEPDRGIAESTNYLLRRSHIGGSSERLSSDGETYQIDAVTGTYLSEGSALSDRYHYEVFHPISWASVINAATETGTEDTGTDGTEDTGTDDTGTTDGTEETTE